jgi:hypothetical protein
MSEYEAGNSTLNDITRLFREHDDKGKIQLGHFPNLLLLVKTFEMEDRIDFSSVEPERAKFIQDTLDVLTTSTVSIPFLRRVAQIKNKTTESQPPLELVEDYRRIVYEIHKELVDVALMFREDRVRGTAIYDLMVDISSLCDIDIRLYPNLLLYIHYMHQAEHIGRRKFLEEIQRATKQIQETLFGNNDHGQRALARTSRLMDQLHKLCSLEMTPELFDFFNREFGRFTFISLLQDECIQKVIPPEERAVISSVIQSLPDNLEEICDLFFLLGSSKSRPKGASEGSAPEDETARLEQQFDQLTFTELLADTENPIEGNSDVSNLLLAFTELLEDTDNDVEGTSDVISLLLPILENPLARGLVRAEIAVKGGYRFSQLATARGRSLVENTLRYMQEQGVTKAVLITGGFLTSKILPVLENERISYWVIMPNTQPSKRTKEDYIGNMVYGSTQSEFLRDLLASMEKYGETDDPEKNNVRSGTYPG